MASTFPAAANWGGANLAQLPSLPVLPQLITANDSGTTVIPNLDPMNPYPMTGGPKPPGQDAGEATGAVISGIASGDYFIRGAVILLGLIFVAVGLFMFKPAQNVVLNTALRSGV